ncbi:hypothetical protein BDV59DRAFT_189965 [Aspergillus ambiguus]|uniref:uncharacterized protein n=1 Tax=Aspergillus ambiguus TaxID=176160 RepID=UPI003CCD820E
MNPHGSSNFIILSLFIAKSDSNVSFHWHGIAPLILHTAYTCPYTYLIIHWYIFDSHPTCAP